MDRIKIWDSAKSEVLVTLPDELAMQDMAMHTGVNAVVAKSLADTPIVFEDFAYGRMISLAPEGSRGRTNWAVVKATLALASVPGARYVLEYHGTDFNVRFANENPPCVSATPVQAGKPHYEDTDSFVNFIINFMEI
jgi:hypothetical protein